MKNYFFNTPIYKIWIDIINYLNPRASLLIENFQYRFVSIVCQREELVYTYQKDNQTIELVYAHEYRKFYCRIFVDEPSKARQAISFGQAEDLPLNSLQDLQNQIDYVMDMLKTRL